MNGILAVQVRTHQHAKFCVWMSTRPTAHTSQRAPYFWTRNNSKKNNLFYVFSRYSQKMKAWLHQRACISKMLKKCDLTHNFGFRQMVYWKCCYHLEIWLVTFQCDISQKNLTYHIPMYVPHWKVYITSIMLKLRDLWNSILDYLLHYISVFLYNYLH
jgi:hypothetical protein